MSKEDPDGCGQCRFWLEVEMIDWKVIGECRRYPPSLVPNGPNWSLASAITHFPETEAKDWCGEFRTEVELPIC